MAATLASVETVNASRTTDFACLRIAATLLLEGGDPYDETTWQTQVSSRSPDRYGVPRPPPCPGRFGYPLWTALPFMALALIPWTAGAALWQLLLLLGVVAGAALAWRAVGGAPRSWPTYAVLLLASFPFWQLILVAQLGGVMLLLVGAIAYAYRERRQAVGGVAVGLLALKPHVAFLVPIVAVAASWRRGERRTIAAAALTFAVLLASSLAIRPAWPAEWLAELFGRRVEMAAVSPTVWSLAARSLGDARYGAAIVAGTFLVVVALVRGVRIDAVSALAVATASSLVLSPYIGLHDEVILALPWAKSLAVALALAGWRGAVLAVGVVACAGLLPWSLDAYEHLVSGDESASGVVPLASLVLLAVAVRLDRHRTVAAA